MAWFEDQKAKGRAELARRKAFEDASTYRADFLKWFGWMIFSILMSILFVSMSFQQQNWLLRASDIPFETPEEATKEVSKSAKEGPKEIKDISQ